MSKVVPHWESGSIILFYCVPGHLLFHRASFPDFISISCFCSSRTKITRERGGGGEMSLPICSFPCLLSLSYPRTGKTRSGDEVSFPRVLQGRSFIVHSIFTTKMYINYISYNYEDNTAWKILAQIRQCFTQKT